MTNVLPDATKNALLDSAVAGGLLTTPFLSLHTAFPPSTGNEVTGGSPAYARKSVTWSAASAGFRGGLVVYWKRLTGADSGTYSFTWTGTPWRGANCGLWSGRTTSGDPFDGTVGTAESTTQVTTLNVSTSPAGSNGDAVGFWTSFNGGTSFTPPTNYTERADNSDVMCLDSRDAVTSGSTGSISATATITDFMKAFLGVLAVAGASAVKNPSTVSQYAGFY